MSMTLGKGGNPAAHNHEAARKLRETQSAGMHRRDETGGGMRKGKGPTFLDGDRLRRRLHAVAIRSAASGEAARRRRRCRRDGREERAPGQGQVARGGAGGREQGRRAAGRGGSGHGGGLHWRGAVADGTMRGGSEREASRAGRDGDRNEDGEGSRGATEVLWGLCFGNSVSGCWFWFAMDSTWLLPEQYFSLTKNQPTVFFSRLIIPADL
jgi:hypothetical protein